MFWEHGVVLKDTAPHIGSNPTIPISPCDAIGRHILLSARFLLVRVQSGVSIDIRSNLYMVSEVEVVETLVCETS